jgi:DNA-binding MarR family transcriptional regulator
MEQQGWVTRLRSEEDRREVLIEITLAGLEARREVENHAIASINEILKPLSQSQKEVLSAGLDILYEAFSKTTEDFNYLPHLPE